MTKQEFWERCGFKYQEVNGYPPGTTTWRWVDPNGDMSTDLPPLDPNNLVKYALPLIAPKKLMMETFEDHYEFCILSEEPNGGLWVGYDKDFAIALVKAINDMWAEE